jgi:putative nucleotidyltransferase with HDIG domain
MEAVYKLLREVKVLPPSPQILPKVLDALRHEQTTLQEIGELIALDPVLTAKLLHYCNSVYFSGREPVSNVPEAIGRVGFQTIFSLVSAVAGSKSFNPPMDSGIDGLQLWKHSLTTAFACKFIAEDIGEDSNLLFTAGLLHDIGRVVLAQAKGAEYGQLFNQAVSAGADSTACEKSAYGFTHADVGACLMESWKLPAILVQAVRFHHQPTSGGSAKKLAAGVCVGNVEAHHFEHPVDVLGGAHTELQGALGLLGLGERHLELYDEQMQENWDFVNTLIQMR